MSMPLFIQEVFQLRGVDEIAIVGKADSVRVVGEEWLFQSSESAKAL